MKSFLWQMKSSCLKKDCILILLAAFPNCLYSFYARGIWTLSRNPLFSNCCEEHCVYEKTRVAFPVSLTAVHSRYSNKKAWWIDLPKAMYRRLTPVFSSIFSSISVKKFFSCSLASSFSFQFCTFCCIALAIFAAQMLSGFPLESETYLYTLSRDPA